MKLARVGLFSGREVYAFLLLAMSMVSITLAMHYLEYRSLIAFDDAQIRAEVTQQYLKMGPRGQYHVLRLRSEKGVHFYTSASSQLRDLRGYELELVIRTASITFLEYMQGFYAASRVLSVYPNRSLRYRVAESIMGRHDDTQIGQIYSALFTASSIGPELRSRLSALGVSHLLAISGFHLGVLSFVLLIMFRPLYLLLQARYFPYRQSRRDLFIIVLLILSLYLYSLGFVPSLLRAFAMMLVGFVLYDRGIEVLSMQTLFVTLVLLLSLWPRLGFSLGFWLSVAGVFSILLFLRNFSHWPKSIVFITLHIWVYLMMLPITLWLFESFSLLHPLSILWTMLFVLFYPLVLLMHLIGPSGMFDGVLAGVLDGVTPHVVHISGLFVLLQVILAIIAIWERKALGLLVVTMLAIFIDAVYQVT